MPGGPGSAVPLLRGTRANPRAATHDYPPDGVGAEEGAEVSTRAKDWYRVEYDWRQVCGDAVSQAKGEKAQDFAAKMMQAANRYGLEAFVTEPQLKWLCEIADHHMPKRITD